MFKNKKEIQVKGNEVNTNSNEDNARTSDTATTIEINSAIQDQNETANNSERLNSNQVDDLISHALAHAILDQEPDKFLNIYDRIPSDFSQLRVSCYF